MPMFSHSKEERIKIYEKRKLKMNVRMGNPISKWMLFQFLPAKKNSTEDGHDSLSAADKTHCVQSSSSSPSSSGKLSRGEGVDDFKDPEVSKVKYGR